jgi:hypothetical protein
VQHGIRLLLDGAPEQTVRPFDEQLTVSQ